MDRVRFKYHPNVWEQEVFSKEEGDLLRICQCCGKETEYFLSIVYTKEDVDCICPECVASGKAAEKFDGQFIQDAESDKVDDKNKIDELFKRTPGYISWQGEYWLACCNDFCAYIGEVGTKELEKMGVADEVFKEYDAKDEYKDVRNYLVKGGALCGYLFKCLHCGKYHLGGDAD